LNLKITFNDITLKHHTQTHTHTRQNNYNVKSSKKVRNINILHMT